MDKNRIETAMYHYFNLVGKTAIVTGAGNGIGKGIAAILADLGVQVMACDIELDSVQATAEEIRARGGVSQGIYCDVRKYEDIQIVLQKTLESFGTVDILINDAAGCGGGVTLDTINEAEWMRLIELNLNSVFRVTTTVLPIMRAKKSGKIVNISSGAGLVGDITDPHYAAAKGGIVALTKELAQELMKDRINVNCVAPGLVDTRMARIRPWEEETRNLKWHRAGTPEDIANAVAFLVSSASDYITGQVLCPNGGAWM